MSLRQIFCNKSLAMCSEMCVRELFILLALLAAAFLSRVSFNRTCFSTPTSSSSTLCWIPLDVSMNFTSRDWAKALPSVGESESDGEVWWSFSFFLLFSALFYFPPLHATHKQTKPHSPTVVITRALAKSALLPTRITDLSFVRFSRHR